MSSIEVFINLIKDEIFRMIDDRVKNDRPSMPSTAKVYSISNKKAKVKFKNSRGVEKIYNIPILQPIYKCEDMELNIMPGDTVFIAYLSGDYNNPVIIGKLLK